MLSLDNQRLLQKEYKERSQHTRFISFRLFVGIMTTACLPFLINIQTSNAFSVTSSAESPNIPILTAEHFPFPSSVTVDELIYTLQNDHDVNMRRRAADILAEKGSKAKKAIPALIDTLKDKEIRESAANALTAIGPKAVSALVSVLLNDNENKRDSVAYALGRIGQPAVPLLISALQYKDSNRRSNVLYALGEVVTYSNEPFTEALTSTTNIIPIITNLLNDQKDISSLINSSYIIGQIGSEAEDAIPILIKLLEHQDSGVQGMAAYALGKIGPASQAAVPKLISLIHKQDAIVSESVINALGNIGPVAKTSLPVVIKAFNSQDEGVRREALCTIHSFGPDAIAAFITKLNHQKATLALFQLIDKPLDCASRYVKLTDPKEVKEIIHAPLLKIQEIIIPTLITSSKDPQADIRSKVVVIIGSIFPDSVEAIPALVTILNDPDQDHDTWAKTAEILGGMGPSAKVAIPALISLLQKQQDQTVQFNIINALESIDSKVLLHALIDNLKHKDRTIRSNAVLTISHKFSQAMEAIPELIIIIKDSDQDVSIRAKAIEIIGGMDSQDKATITALITIIGDSDQDVSIRAKVIEIIGDMDSQAKAAIPELVTLLQDHNETIRNPAIRALKNIDFQKFIQTLIDNLQHSNENIRRASLGELRKYIDSELLTAILGGNQNAIDLAINTPPPLPAIPIGEPEPLPLPEPIPGIEIITRSILRVFRQR